MNIETMKGIEFPGISGSGTFAEAPIDVIQQALQKSYIGIYRQDVYECYVEALNYIIYQFRSHRWTGIIGFGSKLRSSVGDSLIGLSQKINSRIVSYGYEDETGDLYCSLYNKGQRVRGAFVNGIEEYFEDNNIFLAGFNVPLTATPQSDCQYVGGTVKFIRPVLYYSDGSCSIDNPADKSEYLATDFERVDAFTIL